MRGRPLTVDWQEDAAQLQALYRREANPHRRARLQTLWWLRQGHTLREAQRWSGVSYRALQRWVAAYRVGGLAQLLRQTPGHGAPGKAARLTPTQQRGLAEAASAGAFRTAQAARDWIQGEWGVAYTPQGVYSLLRRLGIRPKVPRPQAEKASPEAQAAWKKGG